MSSDGLEKTVKVVISGIIQLLKGIESFGEVCSELWCVVIFERRVVQVKLMIVVI
jgi:hypothetical protein